MYFKKNEKFTIGENETFVVEDLLGEGGQGEVYLVSNGEQKYALKIYKGEVSRDFRFNLKNNIEKGSPSEDFLWPKRLFERADGKRAILWICVRKITFRSFHILRVSIRSKTGQRSLSGAFRCARRLRNCTNKGIPIRI